LLYANPIGHSISATLFIARFTRNTMSGDHYGIINNVAFGVSRPGGGCTRCMGVNITWTLRWFKERGEFGSHHTPLSGVKLFKWCLGRGLHLGTPIFTYSSVRSEQWQAFMGLFQASACILTCHHAPGLKESPVHIVQSMYTHKLPHANFTTSSHLRPS
jgi:hypothetical protein